MPKQSSIIKYSYFHIYISHCGLKFGTIPKEGVLLRNVSPSLVLCDHFPDGEILELQIGSSCEWPFIVCLFLE